MIEEQYFDGRRYTRNSEARLRKYRNYFACGKRLLHQDVWEAHNGPRPPGYHVHHKDEDRANNVISNLECLPPAEHNAMHADALYAGAKAYREGNPTHDRTCTVCRLEFVSSRNYTLYCSKRCQVTAQARKAKDARAAAALAILRRCAVCGTEFQSSHMATIYCGVKCNKAASYRRRRQGA